MQKFLAVKLRGIGDTVIWTSALAALRRQYPEAEIHTLTYESNAAVLAHHPAVTQAHFVKTSSQGELLRALWKMRAMKLDWLLGFHASSALCRWAWVSGAKQKVLHNHDWNFTPSGSVPIDEPDRLEDAIHRDYRVLTAAGISETTHQPTSIVLTPEESAVAEKKILHGLKLCNARMNLPRLAFLPGAGHPMHRYPKDLLLPLIARVKREGRVQPLVIVDRALSQEWALTTNCAELGIPLFDQANLREFIALISRAKRAFVNDSAPGHIAVALGLSTDFIFGPGSFGDSYPYDQTLNPVHRVSVDCRAKGPRDQEAFQYCNVERCIHQKCLRRIDLKSFDHPL